MENFIPEGSTLEEELEKAEEEYQQLIKSITNDDGSIKTFRRNPNRKRPRDPVASILKDLKKKNNTGKK